MAFTVEQRDQLKAAIARGATRLRMGNEEVQYRSLDEMRETLAMIEADLAGTANNRSRFGVVLPSTGRGL
jgi:hypothetical protein